MRALPSALDTEVRARMLNQGATDVDVARSKCKRAWNSESITLRSARDPLRVSTQAGHIALARRYGRWTPGRSRVGQGAARENMNAVRPLNQVKPRA